MHNQYKISGSAKYHKIKTLVIEKCNMDYNETMKPLNLFPYPITCMVQYKVEIMF